MKDKRQGNDLKVAWSIFMQDGEPFRLDGKDVSLYLKNMFGRKELNDFVTTGNIIQWTFYGKDQKNSGKYSLELVINEGEKGMITTDKCDFVNLVSCSCKLQGGEDAPNVETESIELTSTLEYVSGGGSYDDTALWNELENKVDKEEGLGLSEENYTAEDKEKLAGLENYDDSGIKEELAKKVESEVVVDTESTEDFEFGYDDTKIRQEIAELSAEVGKKQDTISDLETIRSGASKGATAIQEVKTINGQSIVGSGNIEIQGGGGGGTSTKRFASLYETTIESETDRLDLITLVPNILDNKDFVIETELTAGDGTNTRDMHVCFSSKNASFNICRLKGLNKVTYQTHYLIKIHIGNDWMYDSSCYVECHNNSWNNEQRTDGLQGLNLFVYQKNSYPIDTMYINFPFKVGDKIRIYGK